VYSTNERGDGVGSEKWMRSRPYLINRCFSDSDIELRSRLFRKGLLEVEVNIHLILSITADINRKPFSNTSGRRRRWLLTLTWHPGPI
jgi:hypothetical protein